MSARSCQHHITYILGDLGCRCTACVYAHRDLHSLRCYLFCVTVSTVSNLPRYTLCSPLTYVDMLTWASLQVVLAPIQKLLPPELTTTFLKYLPITTLAHCQCVCKQWNILGQFPPLWQSACQEAFSYMEYDKLCRILRTSHRSGRAHLTT